MFRLFNGKNADTITLKMKNIIFCPGNNYNKTILRCRDAGSSCSLRIKPSGRPGASYKLTGRPSGLSGNIAGLKRVKELESELHKETELRNHFGLFYITSLVIFFIISCIPDTSSGSPGFQFVWSWAGLLLFLPPSVFLAKKTGMSLADLGITIINLKKSVFEGLLFSFFLCGLMIFIRQLTIPDGELFISWKSFTLFSRSQFIIYISLYWIHSFLQEFIARGVLQGLTIRFFKDSHFMLPVFLISFFFCAAHLRISLFAGVLTFIISIIFGCIYYRHKNLAGVSIVHSAAGILAMALGYL